MQYKYARYQSLLNKITKKDMLFKGDYTLNPYQNCEFGCRYCDSTFDKIIYIKENATEILKKELETIEKGRIIVGSVSDPYQKAEKKYETTRGLLEVIKKNRFSCHILTKSNLILRDLDILTNMKSCMVTISILSLNESVSKVFEGDVPSPLERLRTIKKLKESGIKTGIAIIPILPYITEDEIENIIKSAKDQKADYVVYKHLELKGDQKKLFLDILKEFNLHLIDQYEKLYSTSYMPSNNYLLKIDKSVNKYCAKFNVKNKII